MTESENTIPAKEVIDPLLEEAVKRSQAPDYELSTPDKSQPAEYVESADGKSGVWIRHKHEIVETSNNKWAYLFGIGADDMTEKQAINYYKLNRNTSLDMRIKLKDPEALQFLQEQADTEPEA